MAQQTSFSSRGADLLKLLIATNNPGKLREFEALLAAPNITITSPSAEGIFLQVEETGSSYSENARLKAAAFAQESGLLTLADDSGLEVDALGGWPGIHSARFGGPGATDRDRIVQLLRLLTHVPLGRRTARFHAAVALAHPTDRMVEAQGVCDGTITFRPQGRAGFGYDPIFYIPLLGRTMAQLPASIKNSISHRSDAVRNLTALAGDLLNVP